jgi:hypothetical protein
MLALVRRNSEFAGIIGTETYKQVNGVPVCIGDVVKVSKGSYYNECEGVVGIFTDTISVMGLGSIPISELNIVEITKSHKDLHLHSTLQDGYYQVRVFKE